VRPERRAPLALGIAAVTLAIQNGIVMSFAVLYLPLVRDLGASRAEVAVVQSAVLLLGGFGAPLIGWAFDRLGPRRLFQGGALLAAAAFVVAGRVHSLPALVAVYGVVGGLGLACLNSQPNMVVAALWYPAARGRAIALVDLGTGFGAFCFLPLAQLLVTSVGWRTALLAWAALLVLVVLPLNAFQRLPDGATRPARDTRAPGAGDWTLARALRSSPFWWLVAMRVAASCAFPLVNTHLVAYAIGQGVAAEVAATALGAVSLVSLAGRMTTGVLSDRLGRAPTLTVMYASCALGIAGLASVALTGSPAGLVLGVLFYGLSQGSTGIVGSARAADVFSGPTFGAIYGWLVLATGPGEAFGAWAGGKIFDATGSYLPAFGFAVCGLAAGVVSIWRVRAEGGSAST
jgi:MFS family permease